MSVQKLKVLKSLFKVRNMNAFHKIEVKKAEVLNQDWCLECLGNFTPPYSLRCGIEGGSEGEFKKVGFDGWNFLETKV